MSKNNEDFIVGQTIKVIDEIVEDALVNKVVTFLFPDIFYLE
jgi:hypothetical protein